MEGFNDKQKPQDMVPEQSNGVPSGQVENRSEGTYWEAPLTPETPEEFYSYYQQQLKTENSTSQNYTQPTFTKPGQSQPEYDQTDYNQPGHAQAGDNQPEYNQAAYNQPGYNQAGYNQPGYNQAGYNQPGYNQAGYNQPGYNQAGYNQPGYNQAGYNQPGYNQAGYNQPGYNQAGFNQPIFVASTYKQKPKKRFSKVFASVLVLLIILSGAATAYAFRGTLLNTFALLTKSPVEYYAYVEGKSISNSIDDITPYFNLATKDTAFHLKSDVSIDRDAVDSLLQSSMDISLSDLESQIGIPIESLGLNMFYGHKGSILNETVGVRFNQVDIITLEYFFDSVAKDTFIRLPELSKAFLKLSKEDLGSGVDFNKINIPTTAQTVDLMNRYSEILISNISKVDKEDNYTLKLDTLSTECTKLTVTLTEEDFNKILAAVLKEAKNDEYIINLLPMLEITKEEYQTEIDNSLAELKTSADEIMSGESLKMIVYVDNNSNIIGREFTTDQSTGVFAYTHLTKGSKEEYNMLIKDELGNKIFDLAGNQTKDDGAYDGKAKINIKDPSESYFTNLDFDIEYEDIRLEQLNNRFYQYGTFTLSSAALMGLQVTSESSVKGGNQNNKLTILLGASPLVTINTTTEYTGDYKVEMPPESAEVYNSSQMENYQATMDLDKFISELSDKLGVDLQGLLDNYGY